MNRVDVQPKMLRWACERAGYERVNETLKLADIEAWERRYLPSP